MSISFGFIGPVDQSPELIALKGFGVRVIVRANLHHREASEGDPSWGQSGGGHASNESYGISFMRWSGSNQKDVSASWLARVSS